MPLSTFLFDLDGTLLDSIDLILRSYRHTIRHHRGVESPDELWLRGLGTPLWVQFRHWSDDPVEIEAMVATYRSFNMEHHDALARPYAGVADQVRRIHSAGHKLGLVTSKMRSGALRGLELLQLTNAFHVIVAADEVTNPKPDPEPVLRAMGLLGCGAGETIFIGDSRHDLDCGRAAGVKTAAVLWGPFGRPELQDCCPDYWLEQPKDIERLYEAPIDQPIRRLMADG